MPPQANCGSQLGFEPPCSTQFVQSLLRPFGQGLSGLNAFGIRPEAFDPGVNPVG